ncbi:hypothetical protein ACFVW9_30460 [Streptomyces sp. NPDC058217]|uniref:hypothetical protein n=1 Tax=Streptomyces sp. NPDC058217 TaxID=3346384 RepID=UPI0036EE9713
MSDRDLLAYERMWTTERDQWELHRTSAGDLPILKGDPPMAEVICDDDLADLVTARMLAAGVAVIADHGDCQAAG